MEQERQVETEAQTGEDETEGFGAAFAERSGKEAKEPEAGDKPAPIEPAQVGSEAAPSDEAAVSPQAAPAAKPDPLEGMSPEHRQIVEKLQASERSQRGRVGALTKKLNQQDRTAQPSVPIRIEQEPSTADGEPAKAADLEARLAQVTEEYGDINGPVIEAIKALRAEIDAIKPKVDAVDLDKTTHEMEQDYRLLEGKHPDFAQIAVTPEFVDWAGRQPPNMWAMINSYDPDEVSLAFTLYKAESGISPQAGQGDEGSTSTATDERRARQLSGSRQVAHRGAPAAAGVPDDFKAAFKARAAART